MFVFPWYALNDEIKILENPENGENLELSRTGVGLKGILKNYGLNNIHEMNIDQFRDAMDVLKGKQDKPIDPATIPPENGADGLPWNNPERQ